MNQIALGINDFGINLLRICVKENLEKNVFFSPMCISTALGMAYLGAKAVTKEQMEKVLYPRTLDHNVIQQGLRECTETLVANAFDNVISNTANLMYIDQQFPIKSDFLTSVSESFKTEVKKSDFLNLPEQSREEINQYVATLTKDKIRDFLPEEAVSSLTKMILVSALYFKGNWKSPFNQECTTKRPFRITPCITVDTDMMYQEGAFKYSESSDLKCECLELPYLGDNLSMVILLPKEVNGIGFLEENITLNALNSCLSSLTLPEERIEVYLPKFKLNEHLSLKNALSKMGMENIFDPCVADFSGITGKQDVHISGVEHKAFVEVNEEGTEAAASTAVILLLSCLNFNKEFIVDHPFLFLIRDLASGMLLFLGCVKSPTISEQ